MAAQTLAPISAGAASVPNNQNPNHEDYWCQNYDGGVKFDSPTNAVKEEINASFSQDDKLVTITTDNLNKTIVKVIVKAGSDGGDDGLGNEIYTSPAFTNLSAQSDKEISHVIVCYDETPTGKVKVNKKVDTDGDGDYDGDNGDANVIGFKWGIDNGPTNLSMGATSASLTLGDHTLSENNVSGYVFTGWYVTGTSGKSCTNPNGTTLPVTVTITENTTKSITFCNQKTKTGNIKVVKDVINDDGGIKTYADFTFKLDGVDYTFEATTSPDGSRTVNLPLGTYNVIENEADMSGYSTTYDNCADIQVVHNQTVTCTITNDDTPGMLVVKKVVINDDGGTKKAEDFSFRINEAKSTYFEEDGTNQFPVAAGEYKVTENSDNGYTTTYDNCDVNVAIGETETCTITNDDKPAKVTITKKTFGDSGDKEFKFTSTNGNFGLTAGGSYIAKDLEAGTAFEVTEQGTEGWTLAYVSCDEGANWTWIEGGVRVNLVSGDDVVCEFWNVKLGSISGFKLNDANGNGKMEETEEKLPGWTIQLWAECEIEQEIELSYLSDLRSEPDYEDCAPQLLDETVTDENGEYSFTNLPDGTYYVCEVMQAGWERTFPADNDCHTVVVEDGEDCIANFANRAKNPGNVLGSSTTRTTTPTKVLANTGTPFAQGLIVGLSILGMASGITALSRRRHYLVK
jgi:uncharacterized repeat protein (TIGR02543 family)